MNTETEQGMDTKDTNKARRPRTTPATIMAWTEGQIKSNPDVSSADLFIEAKKEFPALRKLDARVFHATYPLQIRRRLTGVRQGRKPQRAHKLTMARNKPSTRSAARNNDRQSAMSVLLLQFAQDVRGLDTLDAIFEKVEQYSERALTL